MIFADYRVEIIPDSEFRLDGGAMFGVVPRVLWEKVCPPDELNRIALQTNCLFIETPSEKILIETGIGEKWTEKQAAIYGINRQKPFAETLFEKTNCEPADISIVVNTHLHFDHCGGNTLRNANGAIVPQFPNARYFVSKSEFEHAENPTERDRASYLKENWQPLVESRQIELKPDEYEVVKGLRMKQRRGHNASMQTFQLQSGNQTIFGFTDLVPTRHHLLPAWIMSFDLYPLETLAAKQDLLPRAASKNWLCVFYHDAEQPLCRLSETNGKIKSELIAL